MQDAYSRMARSWAVILGVDWVPPMLLSGGGTNTVVLWHQALERERRYKTGGPDEGLKSPCDH
jgi:hypothetical protein